MKKLLVSVVALLATAGLAFGGSANLTFDPVSLDVSPATAVGADTTITIPLYVSGSGTLEGSFGGGMALYLQASPEIQITGIDYLSPGMLWNGSYASDVPVIHNGQLDLNVVTLLPMGIEITAAPKLVGNVSAKVLAGTAAKDYWIRTWQENPGITSFSQFSNMSEGAFTMGQGTGTISVVPEPATVMLLLGGLLALRRRHA